MDALKDRIRRHEGLRLMPYLDSEHYMTIGYGHRMTKPSLEHITLEEAERLLEQDIYRASDCIVQFPFFHRLYLVRREVLCELAFWVGCNGVRRFRKMLSALDVEDYKLAALELYNSELGAKYSNRARELSELLWEGRV